MKAPWDWRQRSHFAAANQGARGATGSTRKSPAESRSILSSCLWAGGGLPAPRLQAPGLQDWTVREELAAAPSSWYFVRRQSQGACLVCAHIFGHIDMSLFPLRLGTGTVSSSRLGSKDRGCASLLRLACPEVPSFLRIPSPGALPGAQHTMSALSGAEGAASPVWIGIGSPQAGAGRLTNHKRHHLSLRLHPSLLRQLKEGQVMAPRKACLGVQRWGVLQASTDTPHPLNPAAPESWLSSECEERQEGPLVPSSMPAGDLGLASGSEPGL